MNPMTETIEELSRICAVINKQYFNNELPTPMITVQKTRKGNLAHCTIDKVWKPSETEGETVNETKDTDCYYEINFAAQALDRTPVDLAVTGCHELVHLSNIVKGIKDCSGKMHNKKFRQEAEAHGLICEKVPKMGWGQTTATSEFEEFVKNVLKPDMTKIHYFRQEPEKEKKEKELHPIYRVYCDKCAKEFKYKPKKKDNINFTHDIGFMCKNCNCEMTIEEDEE